MHVYVFLCNYLLSKHQCVSIYLKVDAAFGLLDVLDEFVHHLVYDHLV